MNAAFETGLDGSNSILDAEVVSHKAQWRGVSLCGKAAHNTQRLTAL